MTETRRALLAGERLVLMLTLVPYLIEKGEVEIAEAAADFGVTAEEMQRSVEVLAVSGVPGDGGFYMPNDLFDIDWDALEERQSIVLLSHVAIDRTPRFTSREASALIAGLLASNGIPAVAARGEVASLMQKLARAADQTPAEVAITPGEVDALHTTIADAIARGRAVQFDYRPLDGEVEPRTVDPIRVFSNDTSWYLQGWCHTRRDTRTFLFDRIANMACTDNPAASHNDPGGGLFQPSAHDVTITAQYPEEIAPLLGAYLDGAAVTASNGVATAIVRVAHLHSLKRLAARMGGHLVIESPSEARTAVAEWAAAGLARYR